MFLRLGTIGLVSVIACRPDSTTPDTITAPFRELLKVSAAECTLATDTRAFQVSGFSAGSASGSLMLAEVSITGRKGRVISLELSAPAQLISAMPGDHPCVSVDGKEHAFALSELASHSISVYQFDAPRTVLVNYRLSRGAKRSIPSGVRSPHHTRQS